MTGPKKPRSAVTPKPAPSLLPTQEFELTADELACAIRFFKAARRMKGGRLDAVMSLIEVPQRMLDADRTAPGLRLVSGVRS